MAPHGQSRGRGVVILSFSSLRWDSSTAPSESAVTVDGFRMRRASSAASSRVVRGTPNTTARAGRSATGIRRPLSQRDTSHLETLDLSPANLDHNGGWGIPLVEALATETGIDPIHPQGKWIWARFKL